MNCWICDSLGDSFEHKFKSSDLRRLHGKRNKNQLHISNDGIEYELRNFNDSKLKYDIPICKTCNNDSTSSHDASYDTFICSLEQDPRIYQKLGGIDLFGIYGDSWRHEFKNLHKYFAKQIGCRLAMESEDLVTGKLKHLILGLTEDIPFKIFFQLNEGLAALNLDEYVKTSETIKHLYNGATFMYLTHENKLYFHGWTTYNWLSTHWLYSPFSISINPNSFNNIQQLIVKSFDITNRNEKSDDIIDWFEHLGMKSTDERVNFIKKLINTIPT